MRISLIFIFPLLLISGNLLTSCTDSGPDPVLWSRTWGAETDVTAFDVAVDESGNLYVTGNFTGTDVDFDPGPDEELRTSGKISPYLACYSSDGAFNWVKTWEETVSRAYDSVSVTHDGIYIGYNAQGIIDLDPGEGVEAYEVPSGRTDSILTRLDLEGNYLWTHVFEADSEVHWRILTGIESDSEGNAVVAVRKSVTGNNLSSSFRASAVTVIDPDGNILWEAELAGEIKSTLAVGPDDSIYVTGVFSDTTDFDPGEGVEEITSDRDRSYLLKLDPDGNFVWVKIWDGFAQEVTVDETGSIYVVGGFPHEADFDPGENEVMRTATGYPDEEPNTGDCFLSKFTSDGEFLWVRSWGGINPDRCREVAVTSDSLVLAAGYFMGNADFDPGEAEYIQRAWPGTTNRFISVLNSDGDWQGTHFLSGFYSTGGEFGLDCDENGFAYMAGSFRKDARFGLSRANWSTSMGGIDAYLLKIDPSMLELQAEGE